MVISWVKKFIAQAFEQIATSLCHSLERLSDCSTLLQANISRFRTFGSSKVVRQSCKNQSENDPPEFQKLI
jgi:hypothetical protein